MNILNSGFHSTTSGKVLEGFLQAAMAAAGFIIDSVYDRMRPCPAYPAAGLPTFRVRLFLDILTSDFHVSTTEMLFDGFLWRKSYGKRELFLTKKISYKFWRHTGP